MVSSGFLFFIALVLYLTLYSLSATYTFLSSMLSVLMWVTVALGAIFIIFIVIAIVKAIFK